eukprot:8192538-Alexandrium_andersonii.AAC.1
MHFAPRAAASPERLHRSGSSRLLHTAARPEVVHLPPNTGDARSRMAGDRSTVEGRGAQGVG